MILLRARRRVSSLTNNGSESGQRSGRNFGQFAFVVFLYFPSGRVQDLHVVQNSLFDRAYLLRVLSSKYSSAIPDEQRAKSQKRCRNASHTRLQNLPKKDPDPVAMSRTEETNASETNTADDHHGNGQTKKETQADLLRHFQLRAPQNDNRNAND